MKIPKEYKEMIISVEKYCTKSELEMLLIIAEGLFDEYQKVKSKTKAKDFAKQRIAYNHHKYDNSTSFFEEYFGDRPELLCNVIAQYRELNKGHKKDEHYLAELLRG